MKKLIKDNLHKKMSITQYEVMMGLWNVDAPGKVNQWVTDDRLNQWVGNSVCTQSELWELRTHLERLKRLSNLGKQKQKERVRPL